MTAFRITAPHVTAAERGADVNAADTTEQTALHWSAVRGSLSAAETLLRAGASLMARDCRGYTVRF